MLTIIYVNVHGDRDVKCTSYSSVFPKHQIEPDLTYKLGSGSFLSKLVTYLYCTTKKRFNLLLAQHLNFNWR